MGSIGIITDSSAQFTRASFPGRNRVETIPLEITYPGGSEALLRELKVSDLPASIYNGNGPFISGPTVATLREQFLALGANYSDLIAIFLSSHLNPIYERAVEAAESVRGKVSVQVMDSQTTSAGLGYLVQISVEAAEEKASRFDIERLVRGQIPHIYTVFCIPSLTYLTNSSFIDQAQSLVGEMLNLLPVFTMEEGRLTPLEKLRNSRHLLDYFLEFLDEFNDLNHIAIIQGFPSLVHESRLLHEHAAAAFPRAPFSEHSISLPLATLFGPRSMGVIAIENPDDV
jgi:DegV family protein with EDD domain